MGTPHCLTCLLRKLYASQETSIKNQHGTMDCFKTGIVIQQDCILSPCLFNFYADYIMGNASLDESQAGIKITRRNINKLRYTEDTTLMTQRGTKKPLDESER